MKVRLAPRQTKPQRGGFTLIELLVVISIIAVLASLILPGVQQARESARRIQCLNNMRNVGVAILNYSVTSNGAVPPLVGGVDYYGSTAATPARIVRPAPWTVHLLPYLDQVGLFDQMMDVNTDPTVLDTHSDIGIKVFTCPSNPAGNNPGALNFVANAGYIGSPLWDDAVNDTGSNSHRIGAYTWSSTASGYSNTNSEKAAMGTGVFWRRNTPGFAGDGSDAATFGTTAKTTLDGIRDGTSQTLMLSENINAGRWLPGVASTGNLGFGVCVEAEGVGTTASPIIPDDALGLATGNIGSTAYTLTTDSEKESRINADMTAATGTRPRPSSYHSQVVNVIFCDGSGRNLSQMIADSVYVRLVSSNGNMFGQAIIDENAF